MPRMTARTHALRTLAPLQFQRLDGAVADVWSVDGQEGGGGFYIAPDPRLVVFLDPTPPPLGLRTAKTGEDHIGLRGVYIPAGIPLWSRVRTATRLNHLDIHLSASMLSRRLGTAGVRTDLTAPRMIAQSATLETLANLAAEEVRHPRRGPMLLDGLLTAALAEVFATAAPTPAPDLSGGLAPYQLAAVERLLHANLARHITIAEMAAAAGLSESWFAHAFKQSMQETPQRWQARLRLEAACALMRDLSLSLAEIADMTGYADQAHMSRVFRAAHGTPPSAWRRQNLQRPGTNDGSPVQDAADFLS